MLKIDRVRVLLRDSRLPSLQHMFLPLPPLQMSWGRRGDEARGLQPFST